MQLYWNKENMSLASLHPSIADGMNAADIKNMSFLAKKRINDWYTWNHIISEYENIFLNNRNS